MELFGYCVNQILEVCSEYYLRIMQLLTYPDKKFPQSAWELIQKQDDFIINIKLNNTLKKIFFKAFSSVLSNNKGWNISTIFRLYLFPKFLMVYLFSNESYAYSIEENENQIVFENKKRVSRN